MRQLVKQLGCNDRLAGAGSQRQQNFLLPQGHPLQHRTDGGVLEIPPGQFAALVRHEQWQGVRAGEINTFQRLIPLLQLAGCWKIRQRKAVNDLLRVLGEGRKQMAVGGKYKRHMVFHRIPSSLLDTQRRQLILRLRLQHRHGQRWLTGENRQTEQVIRASRSSDGPAVDDVGATGSPLLADQRTSPSQFVKNGVDQLHSRQMFIPSHQFSPYSLSPCCEGLSCPSFKIKILQYKPYQTVKVNHFWSSKSVWSIWRKEIAEC